MAQSPRGRAAATRARTPSLLQGLIFGPTGHAMSPSHTRRRGRLYRYYVSQAVLKGGREACPVGRVPAGEVEAAVVGQLRYLIATPKIVVRTWQAVRANDASITEGEVRTTLAELDPIWGALFPAEQARVAQLLVARVDVTASGLTITLRTEGMASLVQDMHGRPRAAADAAAREAA